MRTLKRTMCLVLALVMVLGLGVTGVSAAPTYKDLDKSEHPEAAQVLTLIGVLEGNGDSDLNPQGTLSRAEAAKLATLLMGIDADAQAVPHTFTDVKADHWARNYIGWCQAAGVISGDDDGITFRPEDRVTGYEFAKIMLCALGYDAEEEGFVGDGWSLNIAKVAVQAKIVGNIVSTGFTYDGQLTRDNAFQMAFNTLTANVVDYDLKTTVVTGDFTISVSGKAALDKDGYYNNRTVGDNEYDYRVDGDEDDGITQLCEKVFPGLDAYTATRNQDELANKLMRPGTVWEYNTETVFVPDTAVAKYASGEFTGTEAKKYTKNKLNQTDPVGEDVVVYLNGLLWDDYYMQDDGEGPAWLPNGLWVSNTAGIPGYEVEVYKHTHSDDAYEDDVDPDEGCKIKYDVIVRVATPGVISEIDEKNETITVSLLAVDGQDSYDDVVAGTEIEVTSEDAIYNSLTRFVEDEFIAVYEWFGEPVREDEDEEANPADYIVSVAALTPVNINIKRVNDNALTYKSSILTDEGDTYKMNAPAMMLMSGREGDLISSWLTNTIDAPERDLKVDKAVAYLLGGNILFVDQTEAAKEIENGYAYLYDSIVDRDNSNAWESEGGEQASVNYRVKLLLTDGTTKEVGAAMYVDLADIADDPNSPTDDEIADYNNARNPKNHLGELVYYVVNNRTGRYTLEAYLGTEALPDATGGDVDIPRGLVINTNNSMGKVPAADGMEDKAHADTVPAQHSVEAERQQPVAFDSATRFIVVTTSLNRTTGIMNWMATHNVYDVYGVPKFDVDGGFVTAVTKIVGDAKGDYVADADGAAPVASVVLIVDPVNRTVSTEGVYYILNSNPTLVRERVSETTVIEYLTYPAIVDGVLGTVDVSLGVYVNGREVDGSAADPELIAKLADEPDLLLKNVVVNQYDCIVSGTEMDLEGNEDDAKIAMEFIDNSAVANDHIKLTKEYEFGEAGIVEEDYLISKSEGAAFVVNFAKKTIERIAFDKIAKQTYAGYAIRSVKDGTLKTLILCEQEAWGEAHGD